MVQPSLNRRQFQPPMEGHQSGNLASLCASARKQKLTRPGSNQLDRIQQCPMSRGRGWTGEGPSLLVVMTKPGGQEGHVSRTSVQLQRESQPQAAPQLPDAAP